MKNSKVYTLVTGASSGIGRAIARESAFRGFNVLLVALPEPALDETLSILREEYPNQHFDALGINLMDTDASKLIFDWCEEHAYHINILINNAGIGNSGPFESKPVDFYIGQMQLNIVSLVSLTHYFLPKLKEHDKAYVLNVASMAAFYDVPYKGIYSASKKFVLGFSRSLNKELEKTSINITALCPGGVLTNEDVKLRTQELGYIARRSALQPEDVAAYTLDKMFSGKKVVIPGGLTRILKVIGKLLPSSVQMNMMASEFAKNSR